MEAKSFRGNEPAKIDDKGRLKIPNAHRAVLQFRDYGSEVYVTSLTGESVLVYPMPVWIEVERKLGLAPSTHPARLKYLERVSYYGQVAEIDAQGRLLIQPRLRESALMNGPVDVLGKFDHLEVWNHERLDARIKVPFTDDDALALSGFGV